MSRTENALMRLYENADLRDELTDDEADQVLKWAEAELTRLDSSAPDDAAFEAQVDTLMDMLRKINRFAGRQGQFSAQSTDQAPAAIAGLATNLGHAASPEQVSAAGTGEPASTITALTALLSTPAAPQSATAGEPAPSETLVADAAPSREPDATPAPDDPESLFGDDFDEIDL